MGEDAPAVMYEVAAGVARITINRPGAGDEAFCAGGDLGVASDDSSFGTPEVKRGRMPMMILATIFRTIGRKKGMALLLTADRISAAEAERLGPIHDAVPAAEFDAKVDELAANVGTEDASEGVKAFLEKRDPVWNGL